MGEIMKILKNGVLWDVASIFRVERISELGTMLAVTRSLLIATANTNPSLGILSTLKMG
jgi:hypothetical protein